MAKPPKNRPRGLAGKLLAVEPEYRHALYKKNHDEASWQDSE